VLLLATAGLKLHGLDVSSVSKVGSLSSPWLQTAAFFWETILGLWLLSGSLRTYAWVAIVTTFFGFAVVSTWLSWTGVASCGCLGEIPVAPHWMLGLDIVTLGLLVWAKPIASFQEWRRTVQIALVSFILLGGLFFVGRSTGITSTIIHFILGTALTADDDIADFGTVVPGEIVKKEIVLKNVTSASVRLVGGTVDCSTMVHGATTTIPAGESATVTVNFRVAGDAAPGKFSRSVEVWTDSTTQPIVRLSAVCSVAPKR